MRKTLLSMVALLAASNAAMAQNGLTEIPDPDGSQLMCTVLSPNGKYIGGVCYVVVFVACRQRECSHRHHEHCQYSVDLLHNCMFFNR